jgi:hypothetical protein
VRQIWRFRIIAARFPISSPEEGGLLNAGTNKVMVWAEARYAVRSKIARSFGTMASKRHRRRGPDLAEAGLYRRRKISRGAFVSDLAGDLPGAR